MFKKRGGNNSAKETAHLAVAQSTCCFRNEGERAVEEEVDVPKGQPIGADQGDQRYATKVYQLLSQHSSKRQRKKDLQLYQVDKVFGSGHM